MSGPITGGLRPRDNRSTFQYTCRTVWARRWQQQGRRGAAAVEFAVVAPVLFLLIFGLIEFGRLVMIAQIATGAAREGARTAVVGATSLTEVQTSVQNYLTAASIPPAAIKSIECTDENNGAINFGNIKTGDKMKVTVKIKPSAASWVPYSWFPPTADEIATFTLMRRE